jgi:hypothetical protein
MIFLCKAVDGMVETAPMQVPASKNALTAAELPKLGGGKVLEITQESP